MHRIGQLHFDIRVPGHPADGLRIQQQVTEQCQQALLPALEALFDRLVGTEEVVSIDRLEINVDELPTDRWQDVLVQRVMEAVENALQRRLSSPFTDQSAERKPISISRLEAWLYFLEYGVLPIPGGGLSEAMLQEAALEAIASHASAMQTFAILLRRNDTALQRLLLQHPEPFLRDLAAAYAGGAASDLIQLRDLLVSLANAMKEEPNPAMPASWLPVYRRLHHHWSGSPSAPIHFWEIAWRDFLLSGQSLATAVLVEKLLKKSFHQVEMPVVMALLLQVIEARPLRFALLQPAVTALSERYALTESASSMIDKPASTKQKLLSKDISLPDGADAGEQVLPPLTGAEGPTDRTASPTDAPAISVNSDAKKNRVQTDAAETLEAGLQKNALSEDLAPVVEAPAEAAPPRSVSDDLVLQTDPSEETSLSAEATVATRMEAAKSEPVSDSPEDNRTRRPADKKYWYVPNAGVVLLHPFLPACFQAAGLTEHGKFRDEAAQQQAVFLLHYLASGQSDAPEYDLIFAKFLCGLDLEMPLPRSADWNAKDRQKALDEADQLLQAVIRHWSKLGDTTADGLRQGFLRRPGKLNSSPFDGWLLQVESSGIDVLLDYLPWGLSTLKLPWMPDLLHVEWT